jgi:hypothetical protein
MPETITQNDLNQFIGSPTQYKHWLGMVYTEGVKYLAEKANCFWLIDAIASHQSRCRKDRMLREKQFWTLLVDRQSCSATLICERDEGNEVFRQKIAYTDFPMNTVRVWVCGNTMLLPSEY